MAFVNVPSHINLTHFFKTIILVWNQEKMSESEAEGAESYLDNLVSFSSAQLNDFELESKKAPVSYKLYFLWNIQVQTCKIFIAGAAVGALMVLCFE